MNMMVIEIKMVRGDEVYVYTFTGSWTADWPHIHFTQFVGKKERKKNNNQRKRKYFLGILLRPDHQKPES